MFHIFVQAKAQGFAMAEGAIQDFNKAVKEWEDKVKKNQEAITNLVKKREQYESES